MYISSIYLMSCLTQRGKVGQQANLSSAFLLISFWCADFCTKFFIMMKKWSGRAQVLCSSIRFQFTPVCSSIRFPFTPAQEWHKQGSVLWIQFYWWSAGDLIGSPLSLQKKWHTHIYRRGGTSFLFCFFMFFIVIMFTSYDHGEAKVFYNLDMTIREWQGDWQQFTRKNPGSTLILFVRL